MRFTFSTPIHFFYYKTHNITVMSICVIIIFTLLVSRVFTIILLFIQIVSVHILYMVFCEYSRM